ncbi:MAG: tRNA pseudouridine(38-40) synthase TruA [Beijerinckiaceae bacterium]|nr:tRNA pseudouridine(38-40) synthase TruA [Beijerinckiaceae bacterium]
MPRYKLIIEYDGTPFVGWQRQTNGQSVQQALEAALKRFASESPLIIGAGRTDAGVHATGQVAHVDLGYNWRSDEIRDAMNFHLRPHPISVLCVEAVSDDFQARFSAIRRHYIYRILNRRAPGALQRNWVWHIARALNADAMHEAAQWLLGHHDFSTFRASECQANSPMRTLERLDVVRIGDIIEIHASARSFLHHQVRSMAGSLEHVGSGKWRVDDLAAALEAKDRRRCGTVAPPTGLCLTQVDYPEA